MAALEAAIHFPIWHLVDMDGQIKPGHDDEGHTFSIFFIPI